MHSRKSFNRLLLALRSRVLVVGAILGLIALPLAGQKVIVLTAADVGKVVTGTHHYVERDQIFRLVLKHRIGDQKTWQISLQKTQQFEKSPFTLKSALPATIGPDGVLEIEFGVNYAKSLQVENTISLLATPMGATDTQTQGIAINVKMSVEPNLMFFNDHTKQYSKTLPTFEFVGPGEKMLEVTWNGGGAKSCILKIEDSDRQAFTLVPNIPGAAPLSSGAVINLSNGGTSFHIRYDGAAKKGNADVARFTFTEPGGQSIVASVAGTYQGGNSLFAAAKDLLTKDNLKGGFNPKAFTDGNIKEIAKSNPPVVVKETGKAAVKADANPIVKSSGSDIENPPVEGAPKANTMAVAAVGKAVPSSKPAAINMDNFGSGLLNEEQAKERLRKYYKRFGESNLIKVPEVRFEKNEGLYQTRLRIVKDDSLLNDANFILHFIRAKFKNSVDSVTVNAGDNAKMLGDTTLLLSLTKEEKDKLNGVDSFQVVTEFYPEYESAEGNVANDSLVFRGATFGKVYSNNNWTIILWASVIGVVVLFFVIGFILSRKAVSSFRYLREARYQRERHNANSTRKRVDVETVHIDLARRDSDLIQLAFVDRGEGLDGRAEGGIEKVRSIAATLPAPRRNGLIRFFSWLYAPFGRKREPKFRSVYYSMRIELPRGSVPQHLRLKDDTGMLLLGTTLTGNVLATDHQDFKFTQRPFGYSIYLDPSEFLDYTGAMKTVSIPFRVIEEPFEGYVMTREFNLNLEIAQRL